MKILKPCKWQRKASKIDPLVFTNTNRARCLDFKGLFERKYCKNLLTSLLKKRVGVLLTFLGSMRRVSISEKDLIF